MERFAPLAALHRVGILNHITPCDDRITSFKRGGAPGLIWKGYLQVKRHISVPFRFKAAICASMCIF